MPHHRGQQRGGGNAPRLGDVDLGAHALLVGGCAAGGSRQADRSSVALHKGRAIVHPGADGGPGRQHPQLPSPRLGDHRHEEGGEGAARRQPVAGLLVRSNGVFNPDGPEGPVHGEGRPEDLLRHSCLPRGLLQKLQVEAVVGLGEVQAHGSGLLAGCPAQAEHRGQHSCLELRLLPVPDQQLRVLLEPRAELLGSDLCPDTVDERQHRDGPSLELVHRLAALAQQHHVGDPEQLRPAAFLLAELHQAGQPVPLQLRPVGPVARLQAVGSWGLLLAHGQGRSPELPAGERGQAGRTGLLLDQLQPVPLLSSRQGLRAPQAPPCRAGFVQLLLLAERAGGPAGLIPLEPGKDVAAAGRLLLGKPAVSAVSPQLGPGTPVPLQGLAGVLGDLIQHQRVAEVCRDRRR